MRCSILLLTALSLGMVYYSPLTIETAQAQSGGYYGRDDGYSRDDYERDRIRDERRELERERLQLEQDRYSVEREKLRAETTRSVAPVAERCPSGFQPSENKCSPQERRRGCKDMRLPGGLGCVSR